MCSYLVGLATLFFGGGWRLMLGLSLVPAAIQALVVARLPESPRWLLSRKGDSTRALAALRKLRGTDDVAEEFEAMRAGIARESAQGDTSRGEKSGIRTLLQNSQARRALLMSSALQLFQQFCGVNAIVYFTPQILKQAGATNLFLKWGVSANAAAMLATVLAYVPKIPSVLLSAYLIDKLGRRRMLLSFIPVLAVCLGVLGATVGAGGGAATTAASAAAATAAITLFGIFFGMSLGPLPNILSSELFPTSVRGEGVAAAITVQWLSNMLVAALFPISVSRFGMRSVINGFSVVCIVAWIVVWVFLRETKGVALEDIGAHEETSDAL
jgi:MFS family permease